MNSITDYNELDNELKKKLNPEFKQSIDNFFKIDESSKEGRHIVIEEESIEYIDKMLNKPLEDELSIEPAIDNFKQKVINIYIKILNRHPNTIELMHHSNMLRYEVSTEDEIENILKNSNDYKKQHIQKSASVQPIRPIIQSSQSSECQSQSHDNYDLAGDDHYISIIKKVYDEELRREADEHGIATYLRHMKNGMTEEKIRKALRNSAEYRQNFGTYIQPVQHIQEVTIQPQPILNPKLSYEGENPKVISIPQNSSHSLQLVYCMMGTNRLYEIKSDNYILSTLPYIYKFIFIDGSSEDGTVEYLKGLSDKIEVYIHPWQDRFSEQRNHYLEKLREKNYDGWVITSDTDEHYPEESLKQIISIIPEIEKQGYNGLKVQVVDITVDDNDFSKEISRNINQYWKPLIFKYHPNIRYEGEPHETLTGHPIKWYKSNILYEHRRSKLHILQRATENFFISNSNRYSEKWSDFRFLCTKNNLLNFKDFWSLFKVNKLPKEVEEWIYAHKDDNQDSGDSEVREMAQLYSKPIDITPKKEPDSICTHHIKYTPSIEKKEQEMTETDIDRLVQENSLLKLELNKAVQRIEDLSRPFKLPKETKEAIDKVIKKAFEDDLICEICPDNAYIIRITEYEADVIENRGGETRYRTIKKA